MARSGIRCAIVAFLLMPFTVVSLSSDASAGTYTVVAEVSVGVHGAKDTLFAPGAPCTIMGGAYDTPQPNYMLLWFDFSGWPSNAGVTAVSLQLTKQSGTVPGTGYTVYASAFHADNDTWFGDPAHATGKWQYYDAAGSGDVAWRNSQGNAINDVKTAGSNYLGGTNTWDATSTTLTVSFGSNYTKIENWITGAAENNGLRLYCTPASQSTSPYFYGAGADNVAYRPTLIITADAPEPATGASLLLGGCLLATRRRRQSVR